MRLQKNTNGEKSIKIFTSVIFANVVSVCKRIALVVCQRKAYDYLGLLI